MVREVSVSRAVERDEYVAAAELDRSPPLRTLDDVRDVLPDIVAALAPTGGDELGLALRMLRELRGYLARQEQDLVLAARLAGVSWAEIEASW